VDLPLVDRTLVRLFDLGQNLLVPHDHRVQPGGHVQHVSHGRFVRPTEGPIRPGLIRGGGEGLFDATDVGLAAVQIGLRAVAGGKHDHLCLIAQDHLPIHGPLFFGVEGKGVRQVDGGLLVIETEGVELHTVWQSTVDEGSIITFRGFPCSIWGVELEMSSKPWVDVKNRITN
jgi:hypothetical protein